MSKFVKKANKWCVTWFVTGDKKTIQHQDWFSTQEEAEKFEDTKSKEENETNNNR